MIEYMFESENKNEQSEVSQKSCCEQLIECQTLRDEWQDKCMRVGADFENYKRRAQQERQLWTIAAQRKILLDMLSAMDDFERALAQNKEHAVVAQLQSWVDGIELVYKSMQKILEQNNVHEISQTKSFDPNLHEALVQVDSDAHTSQDVVQVLQKGYMIGDIVLRPAKVSVAR